MYMFLFWTTPSSHGTLYQSYRFLGTAGVVSIDVVLDVFI